MTADNKIINIQTLRKPAKFRGVFSSEEYNNFVDAVHEDLTQLGTAVNSLYTSQLHTSRAFYAESQNLKNQILSLQDKINYNEFVLSKLGGFINRTIDLHDSVNIVYVPAIEESSRAIIKSQFGEVSLPADSIENKFYSFSLRNNNIIIPDDLTVDVTSVFDKLNGEGLKNYEFHGTVDEGEVFNAFNSIDESIWQRAVTFPLESSIQEVEVQLTAVVPATISPQANLIEIVPYPEGTIDITHLSTSPDLGSSFQLVDNFAEENNINATRYHFSPRDVEQVRIRLRCRDWIELGGKKVFIYGLRELGLKLVDYKKTEVTTSTFGKGITSILKLEAPRGHNFNYLYRIDPLPNFFTEDASNRHIFLKLSTTPDYNGVFWDSTQNVLPQDGLSTGVFMNGANIVYAIFTFKFVDSSGGIGSPFPVGTTPLIKSLGLTFTATPS